MSDAIQRAEHAKRLLDDDLVKEAFATIEREMTALWQGSPEADHEGRERIYRMLWSARRFRAFFEAVVENGIIEQHRLQQLQRGQL